MLRSLRNYIQQTKSTYHLTRNKKSTMIRCLPVFKKKKKNSSRSLEDETFGNTQGIKVLGADEEMKKENPKSSNVTQIFHFQSSNLQKLMEKHKKVQTWHRDLGVISFHSGPWRAKNALEMFNIVPSG